jgi:hypothetical protein
LGRVFPNDNLVVIARSRGNRVYYHVHHQAPDQPRGRGAPKRYGERFDLKDDSTWGHPMRPTCLPIPASTVVVHCEGALTR